MSDDLKRKAGTNLSDLSKAVEALQKRLDRGEFLSRKDVADMVQKAGVTSSSIISVASW
jgi:hypothetical protein